jgi:hypothetical protein
VVTDPRREPDAGLPRFVAFAGDVRLAEGGLAQVAAAVRRAMEDSTAAILVFDRETAEVVDLDLRGTEPDVVARYQVAATPITGRGRPRLGVVAREVTLLPRHWAWLARQPGGASTTLRGLVEAARKADSGAAKARSARAYRFMSTMAGDLPGFEEAARALFAGDRDRLGVFLGRWPADVGDEVLRYLQGSRAGSAP